MTRAVYRFVRMKITPDLEPDAEPVTYEMECAVCEAYSAPSEEVTPGQDWALKHAGQHGDHFSYREIITRPYRVLPVDGPP